ncbi:C2H2-type domain-containing protein [Plasmodiophora brassicae]
MSAPKRIALARRARALLVHRPGQQGRLGPQIHPMYTELIQSLPLMSSCRLEHELEEAARAGSLPLEVTGVWDPAKLDALGRPKPKQVRVFWDLDNIYPDDGQSETVSSFLKPLKTFANTIGDCRSIIAFSNHIPSKSGLDELTSRKSIPEYSQDKHISGWDRCSKRFRCGLCGFKSTSVKGLEMHAKQQHTPERALNMQHSRHYKMKPLLREKLLRMSYIGQQYVFYQNRLRKLRHSLYESDVELREIGHDGLPEGEALTTVALGLVDESVEQIFVIMSHDPQYVALLKRLCLRNVTTIVATYDILCDTSPLRRHCDGVFNLQTRNLDRKVTERGRDIALRYVESREHPYNELKNMSPEVRACYLLPHNDYVWTETEW